MEAMGFADPAAWGYSFALIAFVAFAIQLALGSRGGLRATWLLVTILLSALWALAGLGFVLAPQQGFWVIAHWLDLSRIGAWYVFLLLLLYGRSPAAQAPAQTHGRTPAQVSTPTSAQASTQASASVPPIETPAAPARSMPRRLPLVLGALLLAAALLPSAAPGAYALVPDIARFGYVAMVGLAIFGLVLIEQLWRNAQQDARWGLKPLCLGLAGAFIYNLFMYADASLFTQIDYNVWSAYAVTQALIIPFIAIAAARNKEWTLNIHLSRHVVFHSTALLGSGVYLLVAAAIGYYIRFFGGTWGSTLQIALLFGAVMLLALLFSSGTLRAKLRVFVNKNFFSYRYDYREQWLGFTRQLSSPEATADLHMMSVRALANLVESPGGALWLQRDGKNFRQIARWNMSAVADAEPADGALSRYLSSTGWVIDLAELARDPERYGGLPMPHWLRELNAAWVLVPLQSGEDLNGFVVLANPRTKVDINWEVLDLLKTAGRQAASYLGHVQATEALLEARKFDAFNRMSAFVVHDLKNLVAQLNLMMKNAQRHADNPEFQRDMMDTVQHVASRMNHLLLQLRSGATPIENARAIGLLAIAQRIERAKAVGSERLSVQAQGEVYAFGHEERLEHVVGHLVQNALDATEANNGHVQVKIYAQDEQAAVLEVDDNGVGMSAEFVRERLFKAFQSTKSTGMGIGAYESAQYLQTIGGRLDVDSTPNAGTRIKVTLPRHQTPAIAITQAA